MQLMHKRDFTVRSVRFLSHKVRVVRYNVRQRKPFHRRDLDLRIEVLQGIFWI